MRTAFPKGFLGVIAVATALVGCSRQNTPSLLPISPRGGAAATSPQPAASPVGQDAGFSYIYRFKGSPDGSHPFAGLIEFNGSLYGTTTGGGSEHFGTVFELGSFGVERVVHSFRRNEGVAPQAALMERNGKLYGTTVQGGTANDGTIFEVNPSTGAARVVHSFDGTDGSGPRGNLTVVKGALYGTTYEGGRDNRGTVFKVGAFGGFRVLHTFNESDGAYPQAGLIERNGTLYGTTTEGGAHGKGTVFAVTATGSQRVIYSFRGGANDGDRPWAGLTFAGGKLYGTTQRGGSRNYGTVFAVTTSGVERVVHSFTGGADDGVNPKAALTLLNGRLYGTTQYGGAYSCTSVGCGTIFEVDPRTDTERTLHIFGTHGGYYVTAGLTAAHGSLYGTTSQNSGGCDCGTIFEVIPPSGFHVAKKLIPGIFFHADVVAGHAGP